MLCTPLAANAHLTFILEYRFTCACEWDFSDYGWIVKCLCACFVTGCSFKKICFMPVKYTVTLCLICAFSAAWACVCVDISLSDATIRTWENSFWVCGTGVCESMRESACVWKFVCKLCMSQFEKCVCSRVKVHLNSVCEVCVRTCFSSHKCVKVRSSSCVWRCVEGVLNFMCMWKYGCMKMHWSSCTCESMCVGREVHAHVKVCVCEGKFLHMWKYVCVKVSSCTCKSMCVWRCV